MLLRHRPEWGFLRISFDPGRMFLECQYVFPGEFLYEKNVLRTTIILFSVTPNICSFSPSYVASPNSPCCASRVLRCSLGSDRFTQGVGKLDARVRVCVTAGQRRASIVTEPSRESVISVQGPQHSRNTNQFTPCNTNTPHTHSILLRLIQLILE